MQSRVCEIVFNLALIFFVYQGFFFRVITKVWPLIGVMGLATALVTYQSQRYLFSAPEVRWDRTKRMEIIRTNFDEGEKFRSHFKTMREMKETLGHAQIVEIERLRLEREAKLATH